MRLLGRKQYCLFLAESALPGKLPTVEMYGFSTTDTAIAASLIEHGKWHEFVARDGVMFQLKSGTCGRIYDPAPGSDIDICLEVHGEPTEEEFVDIEYLSERYLKQKLGEKMFMGTRGQVEARARKAQYN